MSAKISIIIGPPGTGKTTTLGHWVERAAARYGVDKVLVCSLTRTAAYHAARNIELPFQQFGTVHAFAYRALGQPELAETEKALKLWNETHPSFALSGHGQAKTPDDGHLLPENTTNGDKWKLEYTRLRTLGVPRSNLAWQVASLRGFARRWEDFKAQNHYLDFVDLIEQAMEIDTAPGEPAVLILDEMQDTGSLEWQLLARWAEKAEHLVGAGDPGQALFSWRGSDPLLIQRLWDEHDSERKPLEQSYRLPQAVYDYAWTWQKRFRQTRQVQYLPRKDPTTHEVVQGQVGVCAAFDRMIPEEIRRLILPHTDQGRSVLFLATCGYMLDRVITGLRKSGIPFANPLRPSNGKWNPLPQKRGRGFTVVDRVLMFSRPRSDIWGEHAHFWTAGEVKAWASALPATGVFTRGGHAQIQALPDDASDENISDAFAKWFLPEVLAAFVPKPDVGWYLNKVKGSDNLCDYVKRVIANYGIEKLQEKPLCGVGTVHSVKGGEADVVILAPDISLEAVNAMNRSEAAREEMWRVFYTGCTRAKEVLLLADPSSRNAVRW